MTSVVLHPDLQQFPIGTSVDAFPRSRWGIALEGAPSGSAVETHAVASDATLTYTTLTDGTDYVATAVVSSVRRFLRFQSGPVILHNPTFVGGYTNGQIPIWNTTTGRFEPGSAGVGTTIATDPIWDVKGDLAVGSGADTAVRKAVGADGQLLSADAASAGGIKWVDRYPSRASVLTALVTPIAVVGSAWTAAINTAHWFNCGINNGVGAQNDEVHWDVELLAGTYQLDWLHRQSNSLAIYTLNFDSDSSFGTIDGYAASATSTKSVLTGIVVATSGVKRFKVKLLTKNASSSAFQGNINAFSFTRTGA